MATYRELQDKINLDYLNRTDIIPETKRAIASAIRAYEAQRFWFNETQTATTTTASQAYLSLPSDYLALDRLELYLSGGWEPLSPTTFTEVRDMNIVSTTGQPTHYAYHGDRLELAVIPDSAYPVNVYYLRSLPSLSADSDTNAWTTEAFNLIAHTAVLDLMMGVIQTDDKRILRHQTWLQQAQGELDARNIIRLSRKLSSTKF